MSYGHEFSDRLNPFLVKELRQGLRGKIYLTLFLVLVLVLSVHAISVMDEPTTSRSGATWFNAIVFLTLGVFLPLNGLGAVGEERRGRKIELVMLTRVNARGVVLGKWITGAIQSLTLAAIIAPFIVLRYFSGGVNFVDDLAFLGFAVCVGLLFSALTLCASAFIREGMPVIGALIRGAILIGSLWFGLMMAFQFTSMFRHSSIQMYQPMLGALAALVIGAPLLLEIAAARLSPEAENHDGVIRLISVLAAAATFGVICAFNNGSGWNTTGAVFFAFILLILANAFTLFTNPVAQLEYRTPFDRFGKVGRRLGKIFLTPGWHAGFAFALIALPVFVAALWLTSDKPDQERFSLTMLQQWSALLWPLALINLLPVRPSLRFGAWLGLQGAGILLAILAHSQRWMGKELFDIVPTTGLFNMNNNMSSFPAQLGVVITILGVTLGVIIGVNRRRREARPGDAYQQA
jgi:hypothetical protein